MDFGENIKFNLSEIEESQKELPIVPEPPEAHWCVFFCEATHDKAPDALKVINKYVKDGRIGRYVMSAETAEGSHQDTSGQHFHFACEMSDAAYAAFAKTLFIDKFNLKNGGRGQRTGNKYGKVDKIRSLDKMIGYVLKDGTFWTNMSENDIKYYREYGFKKKKSYKKELKDDFEEMMEHITNEYNHQSAMAYIDKDRVAPCLKKIIFMYHIRKNEKRKDLSRVQMDRLIRLWVMYYSGYEEEMKYEIMNYTFYSGKYD